MTLLVDAASRHPVVVVAVMFVALALLAYAGDLFVARADRDDFRDDFTAGRL